MKRSWLNWKTLALVVVGLVVLGPLIRQAISFGKLASSGVATPSSAPQSTSPTPSEAPTHSSRRAPKSTTVDVGGTAIPGTIEPTILLNPGLVRPGSKVAVSGFGFDPSGIIDVRIKNSSTDTGSAVALAKVDQNGAFMASFSVPEGLVSRSPTVVAQERNSTKFARTQAMVPAGMATVKLGKQVGKPGDTLTMSATGFEPDETVKVYWGQLYGDPAATLRADGGGNVGQAALRIPVGAVGTSNLVLVGSRSQSIAIAQFIMLGLYPTVKVQPYAVKAANRIGLSARGFGPGERILVYINSMNGRPLMIVQADANGTFGGVGFMVPFGLKKQQSLILLGEQSRAVVTSGFIVLPYMPNVQPSTYGGFPGTTLSFYASGFAPNEVALVYKGRGSGGGGELVSAFRVNDRGRAAAAGQYTIPSADQGKVVFTIVGRQSGGIATAAVTVQQSEVPVQIAPQPKYTLPPDLQEPTPSPSPSGQSPASGAPAQAPASGAPAQAPTSGAPAQAPGPEAPAQAPGQAPAAGPAQAPPNGQDQGQGQAGQSPG